MIEGMLAIHYALKEYGHDTEVVFFAFLFWRMAAHEMQLRAVTRFLGLKGLMGAK